MGIRYTNPGNVNTNDQEQVALQMMRPGAAIPRMRRSGPTSIASTNSAAMTQILAVPSNRKHLVKSIILSNVGSANTVTVSVAGQGSGAYGVVSSIPIASGQSISIPVALVCDPRNANVGLFASASVANAVQAVVQYATLDYAELPAAYAWAYGVQGGGVRADLFTTTVPLVVTSVLIGSTSGTLDQTIYYGVLGAVESELIVPSNGLVVIDDPLYLNAGDTFSAANYQVAGNWVSFVVCGMPAQS